MAETPSKRRRRGRNAFCTLDDNDRNLLNPYVEKYKRKDWEDGWDESKAAYLKELQRKEEVRLSRLAMGIEDNV